jgi:hypothetical protein
MRIEYLLTACDNTTEDKFFTVDLIELTGKNNTKKGLALTPSYSVYQSAGCTKFFIAKKFRSQCILYKVVQI